MTARRHDVLDPDSRRVAAVGQHVVARTDRELRERLASTVPFRRRQLEEIAAQRGQIDAVVQPPQRAGPARLLHGRAIERPHLKAPRRGHRYAVLPEQLHAQRVQPVARLPQPLEQGHVRQIRQARLARPHDGLAQGMPAAEMD